MTDLPRPADVRPTVRDRLLRLGELRDAVLFVGTCVYVLGYLTWCIYADHHGLGFLPPLEGQYFVAGVAPTAILWLAFSALRSIPAAKDLAQRKAAARWGERAGKAVKYLFVAAVLVGPLLGELISQTVFALGAVALIAAGVLAFRAGTEGSTFDRWWMRGLIVVTALGAVLGYARTVFSRMPLAFGGPSPRCVLLHVRGEDVGPALAAILAVDARGDTSTAVRTTARPLWLHFEGDPFVLVSPTLEGEKWTVVRLRESSVMAIVPSGGCTTSP